MSRYRISCFAFGLRQAGLVPDRDRRGMEGGLRHQDSRTQGSLFSSESSTPQKIKGASAVKLLRPLKLNRKVFMLPGSI
jgi:hypothetical protein